MSEPKLCKKHAWVFFWTEPVELTMIECEECGKERKPTGQEWGQIKETYKKHGGK